jgi:hypothetical protein
MVVKAIQPRDTKITCTTQDVCELLNHFPLPILAPKNYRQIRNTLYKQGHYKSCRIPFYVLLETAVLLEGQQKLRQLWSLPVFIASSLKKTLVFHHNKPLDCWSLQPTPNSQQKSHALNRISWQRSFGHLVSLGKLEPGILGYRIQRHFIFSHHLCLQKWRFRGATFHKTVILVCYKIT